MLSKAGGNDAFNSEYIVNWCFLAICSILLSWKCGNVFHYLKQLCFSCPKVTYLFPRQHKSPGATARQTEENILPVLSRRKQLGQHCKESSKVCKVFDELRNENNRTTETWVHFLCIMNWISLFSRSQSFLQEALSKVYFYRSNNISPG